MTYFEIQCSKSKNSAKSTSLLCAIVPLSANDVLRVTCNLVNFNVEVSG